MQFDISRELYGLATLAGVSNSAVQGAGTIFFGVWLAGYLWAFVPRAY